MSFAGQGLLTREELIDELRKAAPRGKLAASTIATWEREGMPVIRLGRKVRFYRLIDVIAWTEKRETEAA
jgi:phage terminase Nu1 subunit (DNA packaging protein)